MKDQLYYDIQTGSYFRSTKEEVEKVMRTIYNEIGSVMYTEEDDTAITGENIKRVFLMTPTGPYDPEIVRQAYVMFLEGVGCPVPAIYRISWLF